MTAILEDVMGNTSPNRTLTLERDGVVINLTSALSVNLIIRNELTNAVVNSGHQSCTISTPKTAGIITYAPVNTDFATAGRYVGDVEILYSGGNVEYLNEQILFVIRDPNN